MSLPLPQLDDRDFSQLVEEARRQIAQASPEWTDLSPGDPGIVLLELFAFLTETMIYRLNRLPEKAYIAFLRLLGVTMHPPAAAAVTLHFSRARSGEQALEIPRGTRVTVARAAGSEPPVFYTAHSAILPAGETAVEVLAYHAEVVEGELLGQGTGLPGLTLSVRRPPIVAPTGDELDLVIGVETPPEELEERAAAVKFSDKSFRVWREVDNFTNLGADERVYVADRMGGVIHFAPALRRQQEDGTLPETAGALAAIPPPGREIRAWYRRGGGPAGNVAANTLTTLKDPLPGLEVTNAEPATGGRAAESLENVLLRGPQEIHSLQRALTARDFELVALNSSRAVVRAKALTRADLWRHAVPGTVEVLLVPYLTDEERAGGQITAEMLHARETEVARDQIQHALDERRPLGTSCLVNWAHYKAVSVTARIVVGREEDQAAVKARVLERLYQTINPLPTAFSPRGWPFGQALRASDVYSIALAEPGVRWVDRVRLLVEEVPEKDVATVAADFFQGQTWYAGSNATLFRSLNNGAGWEPAGRFADATITLARPHPNRPGAVAVLTRQPDGGVGVHISMDCGETWATIAQFAFNVEDLAWALRAGVSVLLLATDKGLYEVVLEAGVTPSPVQLVVNATNQDQGFYAVTVATEARGTVSVAISAQNLGGVYLSSEGGKSGTFRQIGLGGEDIRELNVQYDGPRSFLWAGSFAASAEDPGKGCFRWDLRGAEDAPEGWRAFNKGWAGGSCRGLAFLGNTIVAASHRTGVMTLDASTPEAAWRTPDVNCGLPLRDPRRFHPVVAVATDPEARRIMAAGIVGIYLSEDGGVTFRPSSSKEFLEAVTLADTWLFVSGRHDVKVVSENEAG